MNNSCYIVLKISDNIEMYLHFNSNITISNNKEKIYINTCDSMASFLHTLSMNLKYVKYYTPSIEIDNIYNIYPHDFLIFDTAFERLYLSINMDNKSITFEHIDMNYHTSSITGTINNFDKFRIMNDIDRIFSTIINPTNDYNISMTYLDKVKIFANLINKNTDKAVKIKCNNTTFLVLVNTQNDTIIQKFSMDYYNLFHCKELINTNHVCDDTNDIDKNINKLLDI